MEIGIPLRTPDGTFAGRCNRASKSWGSTVTVLWLPVPDHTEFILVLCKTLKPTHDEFKGVAFVSVIVTRVCMLVSSGVRVSVERGARRAVKAKQGCACLGTCVF